LDGNVPRNRPAGGIFLLGERFQALHIGFMFGSVGVVEEIVGIRGNP